MPEEANDHVFLVAMAKAAMDASARLAKFAESDCSREELVEEATACAIAINQWARYQAQFAPTPLNVLVQAERILEKIQQRMGYACGVDDAQATIRRQRYEIEMLKLKLKMSRLTARDA